MFLQALTVAFPPRPPPKQKKKTNIFLKFMCIHTTLVPLHLKNKIRTSLWTTNPQAPVDIAPYFSSYFLNNSHLSLYLCICFFLCLKYHLFMSVPSPSFPIYFMCFWWSSFHHSNITPSITTIKSFSLSKPINDLY